MAHAFEASAAAFRDLLSHPAEYQADLLKSQAVDHVAEYIAEIEDWLFDDFRRAIVAAASGIPAADELTAALRPWVDDLSGLGNRGILNGIRPAQASKLNCLLNHALDALEKCYLRNEKSTAEMMSALHPVDDLLVLLSLRSKADEELFAQRGLLR